VSRVTSSTGYGPLILSAKIRMPFTSPLER
jgi:hypothetical protein